MTSQHIFKIKTHLNHFKRLEKYIRSKVFLKLDLIL